MEVSLYTRLAVGGEMCRKKEEGAREGREGIEWRGKAKTGKCLRERERGMVGAGVGKRPLIL